MPTPLVGFNEFNTQPLGMIKLLVLMGTHPQQVSIMTNFIVVEAPSAYNVILGRSTLTQARSVMLTHSLVIKFSTPKGTRILKGDQATARSCYVTSLRRGAVPKALTIEDPRGEKDGMSLVEELTQVALDPRSPDRLINIGSLLNSKL